MNPTQQGGANPVPTPPARPVNPINVPPRPAGPTNDIDDSAFGTGATPPAQRPPALQPISTPPAPQPIAPPIITSPTPPPAPTPLPTPVPPPVAPAPPQTPPVPPAMLPPNEPPKVPTLEPQTPITPVQPQPATLPGAAPQLDTTTTTPEIEAAYSPTPHHLDNSVAQQIAETPQQNSGDIQARVDQQQRVNRLKGFFSFIAFVGGILVAAFLINQFIFQSYYVEGTSMANTLQNNDRLIIDKVERTWSTLQGKEYLPARGQIVVLDSSIVGPSGRSEQLIKRVIGLPGDSITIKDGVVTIKNSIQPKGFNVDKHLGLVVQPTFTDAPIKTTVQPGQVFVMGDNRAENGSYDSRAFGTIPTEKIQGRLWARILPFDKMQIFD